MLVQEPLLKKLKRGFYEGVLEIISENPARLKKGQVTELHTRCLEKVINENPQYWLWSHKRWKRKMNDEKRRLDHGKAIVPAA